MRDNFALAYAAGALACRFGIFPFGAEIVLDRLKRCLLDALTHAGVDAAAARDPAEEARADAKAVRRLLRSRWKERFDTEERELDAAAAGRLGLIQARDADGNEVCLARMESLAEAVPDQRRLDAALRGIAARGHLLLGKGGKLTRQKRLPDGTRLRFLFFKPDFCRPKRHRRKGA